MTTDFALDRQCITDGCGKPTHGFRCTACLAYIAKHDKYPEPGAAIKTNGGDNSPKSSKRSKPMLKVSEAEIRIAIKGWYRLQGARVYDTEQNRADARVDAGLPDLIVLWPGKPVRFVEVKSATGTQRPAQKQFEEYARRCGDAVYLMPRSLQEVIDYEEMGF